MKKGDKLFARVDSKMEGAKLGPTDFDDHIEYLKRIASERFFIGGGFVNRVGGMIIFEAKDLAEAREIADNDPLIRKNLYTCELFEWDLVIVSDRKQKNMRGY